MDVLTTATSPDERVRASPVAVLPVGSFEQHGAHLPLTTDTLVACVIAREIAAAYDLFLLPPVTISCSHEHAGFAGTVSISATTLHHVISDVADDLARSGITKLAIVNGHGGNYVLSNIVQEANAHARRMMLFPGSGDWSQARTAAGMVTGAHDDMHGGEAETSLLLHAVPHVVRDSWQHADHQASERPHFLLLGMSGYTDTGIIGTPSAATAAKGDAMLGALVASFADPLKLLTAA